MRAHGRSAFHVSLFASVVAWVVVAAIPAQAATAPVRLSIDPYTNTSSQHKTELEPDTFSFGSTIVSAFQVGRFFNGGASNIGWATSTDGGATWSHGFLPGITVYAGGTYDRASDPVVAYDAAHGVWMISTIAILTEGNPFPVHTDVLVNRSTDGGLTWDDPVPVSIGGPKSFLDKNWTACDDWASSPFYGRCYTEFDDNGQFDLILMSTSTDGGLTWGAPVATANAKTGIGGQPTALPDGTVIVPINGFTPAGNFTILSFSSADGGVSWGPTRRVSVVDYVHPAGTIRASIPLPSAEIDSSGQVYVAWPDCRFEPGCAANDIVFTTTTDGVSWTPVQRIPIDAVGSGTDHFIPGLGVDRATGGATAGLGLTYYSYPDASCSTATCQLDVGFISSADGGATWSEARRLAGPMNLGWLPATTQGYMVGDYVSTSVVSGTAVPLFAFAKRPVVVLRESAYTSPVAVVGGTAAAQPGPPAVAGRGSPVGSTAPTAY